MHWDERWQSPIQLWRCLILLCWVLSHWKASEKKKDHG